MHSVLRRLLSLIILGALWYVLFISIFNILSINYPEYLSLAIVGMVGIAAFIFQEVLVGDLI